MASRGTHLHLVGENLYASDVPPQVFCKPMGKPKLLRSQLMPPLFSSEEDEIPDANRIANIVIHGQMSQPPLHEKTLVNSLLSSMRSIIQSNQAEKTPTQCVLSPGTDQDVYCEVFYTGKQCSVNAQWQISNQSEFDWPSGIELKPIISSPWVIGNSQSSICELRAKTEGLVKVRVDLPDNFKPHHLVLMLKLQTKEGKYFGRNLVFVAKLIDKKPTALKESLFASLSEATDQVA